jgi:hypothetical protein
MVSFIISIGIVICRSVEINWKTSMMRVLAVRDTIVGLKIWTYTIVGLTIMDNTARTVQTVSLTQL